MALFRFRIGTKLALSAGLGVALVVAMLVNEQLSSGSIMHATGTAMQRLTSQAEALAAEAAMRGMRLANRDVRMAVTPAEVERALSLLQTNLAEAEKRLDAAARITLRAEQRERFTGARANVGMYAAATADIG